MLPNTPRRWTLRAYPVGEPRLTDFKLETFVLTEPLPGEVLVKVHFHTVAPGIRAKLAGDTYTAQVKIGDTIPGYGVGIVEASNCPELAVGDQVAGELAWSTHALVRPAAIQLLDPLIFNNSKIPLDAAIGVLGASGLTAYFGLLRIGQAKAGDTVLVSSASGAVGSIVGQIARIIGCRTIGIAGSAEKCAELQEYFGFDAAINYRAQGSLSEALHAAAPDGVDLYYDNVGGDIAEAAVDNLKLFGRVVVCGQTSDYNRAEAKGFRSMTQVITKRLTLRGFVVHDFSSESGAARAQLAQWLREGHLVHRATIEDGIGSAAEAFIGQFTGRGAGRPLIRVA